AVSQAQPYAGPLHAVREQLCRDQDHRQGDHEQGHSRRQAGSRLGDGDLYGNIPDEPDPEQTRTRQHRSAQTSHLPDRQVHDAGRDQRYRRRDQRRLVQVPGGEADADRRRDAALEHHRAADVAHGQRVLALAHPDDAVELLRQLRRQGRDDQGQRQRRHADLVRDVLEVYDEDLGADDDERQSGRQLQDHEGQRRPADAPREAVHVQRVHLLFRRLGLALVRERADDVVGVQGDEDEGHAVADQVDLDEARKDGQQVDDEEETEV